MPGISDIFFQTSNQYDKEKNLAQQKSAQINHPNDDEIPFLDFLNEIGAVDYLSRGQTEEQYNGTFGQAKVLNEEITTVLSCVLNIMRESENYENYKNLVEQVTRDQLTKSTNVSTGDFLNRLGELIDAYASTTQIRPDNNISQSIKRLQHVRNIDLDDNVKTYLKGLFKAQHPQYLVSGLHVFAELNQAEHFSKRIMPADIAWDQWQEKLTNSRMPILPGIYKSIVGFGQVVTNVVEAMVNGLRECRNNLYTMDRQSNQDHIKNGLANMGGGFMEALGLRQCGLFSQKKVTYWGVKLNHNPSQNG